MTGFTAMLRDFDKLENFIFDFVPFTSQGEKRGGYVDPDEADQEVMNHLKNISTSFKNIYQDEARKHNGKEKKAAYKLAGEYFERLMQHDEPEYEEQFKQQRDAVFTEAIQVLFKINKKSYLNGFNLKYLSLPIEHSL